MNLVAGFSVIASVLPQVGFTVSSPLSVAARRRELAIRSAVGAQQSDSDAAAELLLRETLREV